MEQIENSLIASHQVRSKFTVNFDRTFFCLYPYLVNSF
ncbi:protein in Tap1-dppD intergenic region [Aggregatibacter aphrophilus NJ8700]|nr:protein in Tap1-dppD intergenic region [Aggregatibacter aphrophilus NJ8700]